MAKGHQKRDNQRTTGDSGKRPAIEGQSEDNWGQWQKATLEDRGVESISGMVNKAFGEATIFLFVNRNPGWNDEKKN